MNSIDDKPRTHKAIDDRVLREFWERAGLDPGGLAQLDDHIRLPGTWEKSLIPRESEMVIDDERSRPVVSESITAQISRIDVQSGSIEIVLTLGMSPVDFHWIEVARIRAFSAGVLPARPARRADDEARISSQSPARTDEAVEAIVRLRARRRNGFFTCSRCNLRQAPEERCTTSVGHCCCFDLGVIH